MTSYSFYNLEPPPPPPPPPADPPNNFNFSTLVPNPPSPTKPIDNTKTSIKLCKFTIDETTITQNPNHKEKFHHISSKSYELIGGRNARYTQNQNLKEKLDNFMHRFKEIKEKTPIEILKNGKNLVKHSKSPEKQSSDSEKSDKQENRYFNHNASFFCFRCKKPGHFQKACPEEDLTKPKCLICLDENHHISRCESYICYKCLKTGHMARDCKSTQGLNCFRCRKRGHKAANCRVLIENNENETLEGVKCLKCQGKGHINCNKKIKKGRDDVYRGESVKKKVKVYKDDISNLEYFEDFEEIHSKKDRDKSSKSKNKKKNKSKKKIKKKKN